MTVSERYLLLGLRLGRHVDGLVDAYYGPPELARQAASEEPVAPAALAGEAEALLAEVPDGWLADQVRGLHTYARVLGGEEIAYADEVERCYGVRPELVDVSVYQEAHARLDEVLPGDGSLLERREALRAANRVPPDRVVPLVGDFLGFCRARTAELFGLPEGESVLLEPVQDEPWWAFNYYKGGLTSRVVVNTDVPTTVHDAVELAAHEAYPGHHTEHVWKEQLLVREAGGLEETIFLVPTPQSLFAEGIATLGSEILFGADGAGAADIAARHGLEYDVAHARAVEEAAAPLRTVMLDAALMIHGEGRSSEETQAFVERWALQTPERAAHTIRFVTDPPWRAYTITYSAGEDLCRAWTKGDPARFRRLLTEQLRVSDLRAELSSGS